MKNLTIGVKTFTDLLCGNVSRPLFFILLLFFVQNQPGFAQSAQRKISQDVIITSEKIPVINSINPHRETIPGKADGAMDFQLSNVKDGLYDLLYEFKIKNNFQSRKGVEVKDGKLKVDNLVAGLYLNIKLKDPNDPNIVTNSIENITIDYGRYVVQPSGARAICGPITFVNCNGNSVTQSGLETGKYYNVYSDLTYNCGFGVTSSCTATDVKRWHCIEGNRSAPNYTYQPYTKTNYVGVGLSALTAARIAWIICNYPWDPTNGEVSVANWSTM